MSNRHLISVIALLGVVLGGCEKEQDNDVAEPDRAQPQVGQPEAERMGEAEAERQAAGEDELEVLPAVTVLGIEIDCAPTDIYFPTDSSELDDDNRAVLDQVAACLKATPGQEKVEITGRADPRGPEPYNEKLSRERAQAVVDYLQKQGVKPESFEIRARGEEGAIEGFPQLWPLQREAEIQPMEPDRP